MSSARSITVTGKARTYSERAPYLKVNFWADTRNHFWESPSHTEKSREYFRANVDRLLSNLRNLERIENSQV